MSRKIQLVLMIISLAAALAISAMARAEQPNNNPVPPMITTIKAASGGCSPAALRIYKNMYVQMPLVIKRDTGAANTPPHAPDIEISVYNMMKDYCKLKDKK